MLIRWSTCDEWVNYACSLSYHHHQIVSMILLPLFIGLGHETMVCAVCLSIFIWTFDCTNRFHIDRFYSYVSKTTYLYFSPLIPIHWDTTLRTHLHVSERIPDTFFHYNDVIVSAMASQITSLMIVYSTVYSGADQTKHRSSASLAFVREFTGEFPA